VDTRCFTCLLLFWVAFAGRSVGQERVTLSGFVKDARSGEMLIGAVVRISGTETATATNSYGFFSLNVPTGTSVIEIAFVGYAPLRETVSLAQSINRTFEITPVEGQIEEVEVSASSARDNVRSPQMGLVTLNAEEIKNVPVLFGERDIIKTVQLLPGVATGGEGSTDFYVRGGGSDQNLILLDEATVYNAAHLMGFFSTFNSDAVKDLQLYKGGIPARYGGRASSVLDISMLDGNKKNITAEGGIGLIASRLKLEGPVRKDRSSLMLSGRRTYADLFLKLSNDSSVNRSKLYFYDLNAKFNYKLDERNTLYLSGYFGKDELGYSSTFGFDWGNSTATARWNRVMSERLFGNTSLIYSDFTYHVKVDNSGRNFRIASKVKHWNLKQDFSFYADNRNTFRFGANVLDQRIRPANIETPDTLRFNILPVDSRQGLDLAVYGSHEWRPTDRLAIDYGLRLTNFMVLGAGTFYTFDRDGERTGERRYNSWEVAKNYFHPEPRLSMSYRLGENNSLKASYNRIVQHLHQLTNTTTSLPTDQYVVSSRNIKPQIADQVATGYFWNFGQNRYEFSTELYYKHMGGQIDYRNGADLQGNPLLESQLLYGIGRAYGAEFFLRRRKGRLTGWLSYTLAKSERRFDQIMDGQWFNARQDRTHDLSVVGMLALSEKWTLGTTWVFNTGHAVTFPSGKYTIGRDVILYYTERNAHRMPDYHRLDIAMTYEAKPGRKRLRSSWVFGVYNAYNRKNTYMIDFRESDDDPQNRTEAYRIALFGAIPSVTWNFKF